jgi:hypothetical protein
VLCCQPERYTYRHIILTSGTDVAVSDHAGITIYSLATNTEKKLKGITVRVLWTWLMQNARDLTFSQDSKTLFFSSQKSKKEFVIEAYSVTENRLTGSLNVIFLSEVF